MLSADGVGISPLADYPGKITFPLIMTLPMHKRWQAFVNSRSERDPDSPRVGIVFTGDGADNERVPFLYDDAELARMFATINVTGPDGKKITEKTSEDAIPLPVAVWIAKCYREWENSQVMFRWNGIAGVVASVGTE
jgi:hypothetical protein